jgi:FAD-dependent oxidoreductase family protein
MTVELKADVLVCGGGMAGSVAAIASGRAGANTLLVERWGFLGGSATAAAVGQFVGWETAAGRRVIRGIAEEIVQQLIACGASSGHTHFVMSSGHRMDQVPYDPERLKLVLDELVSAAPARALFHAMTRSVGAAGRAIETVELFTKAGAMTIRPKVVIDASGDLDLLARAGASFLPLGEGEALQPATMMFRFGPIDYERFGALSGEELQRLAKRGVEEGALARAALHQSPIPGTRDGWFNISRVSVDATDPLALSAAEMEGRRQAFAAAGFLAASVPGCEKGRLVALAPQLGIRESRRIRGEYILAGDDLRSARHFPDAIAAGAYPIDIHPAKGAGLSFETLGEDHSYEIPYRCLVPADFDNVLVAGRGISCGHDAHGATRVMPSTMAIGQAAGTAAAMMAQSASSARAIPTDALRARLREAGVYLP